MANKGSIELTFDNKGKEKSVTVNDANWAESMVTVLNLSAKSSENALTMVVRFLKSFESQAKQSGLTLDVSKVKVKVTLENFETDDDDKAEKLTSRTIVNCTLGDYIQVIPLVNRFDVSKESFGGKRGRKGKEKVDLTFDFGA